MNQTQVDAIPDHLLIQKGTATLRSWLNTRGLRLSLLELDNERRRRQIQPPMRTH